jgi:hypothetical protein
MVTPSKSAFEPLYQNADCCTGHKVGEKEGRGSEPKTGAPRLATGDREPNFGFDLYARFIPAQITPPRIFF